MFDFVESHKYSLNEVFAALERYIYIIFVLFLCLLEKKRTEIPANKNEYIIAAILIAKE